MITIVTLGKTKRNYLDMGIEEYSKRISRFAKLKWVYLPDIKLTSTNNIKIVKEKEAEIILHYLKNDNAYKILLDEKGKELSSIEFANLINKKNFNISFIIGGVYGTADKDSFVSTEKAEKKLGWKPKYNNAQALIRSYKWFIEHYDEVMKETGVKHRTLWKQGVLKIVKWIL